MSKIKDIFAIAGVALLVGAVLWLACSVSYRAGLRHAPAPGKPDTVYIDNTIHYDKPEPDTVYRDTGRVVYVPVIVKDSTGHADTTAVPMHPEVKQYEDSTYRAQVSGIQPNLDWIEIYQRTYYITREVQVPGPAPRWSLGVTAGPGILWDGWDGKVHGGIGIVAGLQFRF